MTIEWDYSWVGVSARSSSCFLHQVSCNLKSWTLRYRSQPCDMWKPMDRYQSYIQLKGAILHLFYPSQGWNPGSSYIERWSTIWVWRWLSMVGQGNTPNPKYTVFILVYYTPTDTHPVRPVQGFSVCIALNSKTTVAFFSEVQMIMHHVLSFFFFYSEEPCVPLYVPADNKSTNTCRLSSENILKTTAMI